MKFASLLAIGALSLTGVAALAAKPPAAQPNPITEVILETQPGFVAPPFQVYKVVLRADGKAWSLSGPSDNMQKRMASLDARTYRKLAQLLMDRKFFAMRERYAPEPTPTDGPSVYIRATRGGTVKTVEDYLHSAPLDVWTVEMTIRGIASELDWKPATSTLPAGVKPRG